MYRNAWLIGLVSLLAVTLTACGASTTPPTLAADEASVARGGSAAVSVSGQLTEGVIVVGTGTANAEPEISLVTFGVELRGDDPAALVDQAAQTIDRAIAAAADLGVAEEDMETAGYSLWVENVYDPETGMPTGEVIYHVSHYVQATVRDLDRVGDVLAGVVGAGANTISAVSFSVEDPEALVEQARQTALESAQAQAQQIASGLGITLGQPVLVMETGGGYPVVEVMMERAYGGGMAPMDVAAPSISPGAFSVSVSVQVVYEIR